MLLVEQLVERKRQELRLELSLAARKLSAAPARDPEVVRQRLDQRRVSELRRASELLLATQLEAYAWLVR